MKRFTLVLSISLLAVGWIIALEAGAQGLVTAELGLNRDIYFAGGYIYIYVNVANQGPDVHVDAYLTIKTPDGQQLYAPDFTPFAHPFQPDFGLPSGWESGWVFLDWSRIPSYRLLFGEPGEYVASFWLNEAGTDSPVAPASTWEFRTIPCELDSWVNDNRNCSIYVTDNWVWAGLTDGVARIAYDNSSHVVWKAEYGVRTADAILFEAFDGKLGAAGRSIGVTILDSTGWRTILNDPVSPGYVYNVLAAQVDSENTLWIVHDGGEPSGEDGSTRRLARVWPDNQVDDHTSSVDGAQNLCLTNGGELCVVGASALYLFDGGSFDRREVQNMPSSIQAISCDANGNVWLGGWSYLVKYELETGLRTDYSSGETGVAELNVTDIASEADGCVWFANNHPWWPCLIKHLDGQFTRIDASFLPTSIDIHSDGKVYCGSYSSGVQVYDGATWTSLANPSPSLTKDSYAFAVGMQAGQAALAGQTYVGASSGYELFDGAVWRVVAGDVLPSEPAGLSIGSEGLWTWGTDWVWRQTAKGWLSWTNNDFPEPFGNVVGVLQNDRAEPYLLTSQSLFKYENASWSTLELPPGQDSSDFKGFFVDRDDRVTLFSYYIGSDLEPHGGIVHVRSPGGTWAELRDQDPLPAEPHAVGVSEDGALYVCGRDEADGEYLYVQPAYEEIVSLYWLRDQGYDPTNVSSIVFDLADRPWLMTPNERGLGQMLIHDPKTGAFSALDETRGFLPTNSNRNEALVNNMFDRSFSKYGTLWWTNYGGVKRINLAPQARFMVDRELYIAGDPSKVQVHFTNYAGSIAVDWYAGLQFWDTDYYFYWAPNWETGESTWVTQETPALRNLTVPTDTSFIFDLGEIIIPDYAHDGHYKWHSGFKRAGEDEWLGLGFPSYEEFCVIAPL